MTQTTPTSPIDITDRLENEKPYYGSNPRLATSLVLRRYGSVLIFYFFETGIGLLIYPRLASYGNWINWQLFVPKKFENQTRGLMGLLDGDPTNDFRLRDGIQLTGTAESDIYESYRESCEFVKVHSFKF